MTEADGGTVLSGGRFAQPVRRGDEVHRTAGRGAGNVHPLLDHFATRGCALTPRVRGTSADGAHEVLSWLPGTAAVPPMTAPIRSEQALVGVARAIRTVHDAAAGFTPPPGGSWQTDTLAVPDPAELIGHRDLGSWNILFDGPEVVGIIDWDLAGPTTRAFDLAIAAHSFVPLHPTRDLPRGDGPPNRTAPPDSPPSPPPTAPTSPLRRSSTRCSSTSPPPPATRPPGSATTTQPGRCTPTRTTPPATGPRPATSSTTTTP